MWLAVYLKPMVIFINTDILKIVIINISLRKSLKVIRKEHSSEDVQLFCNNYSTKKIKKNGEERNEKRVESELCVIHEETG